MPIFYSWVLSMQKMHNKNDTYSAILYIQVSNYSKIITSWWSKSSISCCATKWMMTFFGRLCMAKSACNLDGTIRTQKQELEYVIKLEPWILASLCYSLVMRTQLPNPQGWPSSFRKEPGGMSSQWVLSSSHTVLVLLIWQKNKLKALKSILILFSSISDLAPEFIGWLCLYIYIYIYI